MADFNIGGMKLNKTTTYVSVAAAGGIIAYTYYRRKKNPPSSSDQNQTPTQDPNIDPATGIPYADEYGGTSGQYPYTGMGIYDPATGQIFGTGYGNQTVTHVSTNAAWAQAAEQYLASVGVDSQLAAAAIGKGLTGQYITPDQLALFDEARAFEGEPPETYPPLNTHAPGPSSGGTTGGSGSNALPAPGNVHVTRKTRNSISFAWDAVSSAHRYHVYRDGTYAGSTTGTGATISHLSPNHSYRVSVKAMDSSGNFGATGSTTATTNR